MLEGEQPVSVVMLADSGSGKSGILRKLECPITHFLTDMTTRDLSLVMADPKKRIILLSDMQSIFSHKSTVSTMTTQALRNLLEEGIFNDPFSGTKVNRRFGMLTAIPPNEYNQFSEMFQSGGLNTRFLIFEYRYHPSTIEKIHSAIEKNKSPKEKAVALPEDGEYIRVTLPAKVAADCRRLAMTLKRENEMGIRLHHQIRRLVMGNAARFGRTVATKKDMEKIAKFSAFLTENREPIIL